MGDRPAEDAPYVLHRGDVLEAYAGWPPPATIVSDGAYGVRGFYGDTNGPDGLVDWYRPHVERWRQAARPATTLWFWNTELGWATVHPLLVAQGWDYVQAVTWDKGVAHIAGNVNGQTIRRFPVVSGTLRRAAPRVYKPTAVSATHLTQKPLEFMERLIYAVTGPDDVVWEPFGGLASASVAAVALGRRACVAEIDLGFARLAGERLALAVRDRDIEAEAAAVTRAAVVGPPAIGAASTGRSTGSDKSDDNGEFMAASSAPR